MACIVEEYSNQAEQLSGTVCFFLIDTVMDESLSTMIDVNKNLRKLIV